jgi:hypothetical protein
MYTSILVFCILSIHEFCSSCIGVEMGGGGGIENNLKKFQQLKKLGEVISARPTYSTYELSRGIQIL